MAPRVNGARERGAFYGNAISIRKKSRFQKTTQTKDSALLQDSIRPVPLYVLASGGQFRSRDMMSSFSLRAFNGESNACFVNKEEHKIRPFIDFAD